MQFEPGVDRHDFESRWHGLEDDLPTSPAEALPELADLMRGVVVESGYDVLEGNGA